MSAPEVRQNLSPDSDQFGSVAVNAGAGRWLVANPTNGGHWADDAEVDGWTAGTFAVVVHQDAEAQAVVDAEPDTAQ